MGITSTGEVSEIKRSSAVLSASVQTEGVDSRDDVYVGFAWSPSESGLCADGDFESSETPVQNVSDGAYSASLGGLSDGTTYYYASFTKVGDVYVFSSVKKFITEELPEGAVDLGLSVLWANCNVGAESPEEYGGYYAWGETEEKTYYSWKTYKWCNGNYGSLTKYCTYSSYGRVDNKTTLDPEDDVAHVQWGGNWRMPTNAERDELRTECDWEWTSVNGVSGYLITGPSGNSIFLPAAGYRDGGVVDYRGARGYYWSATLYSLGSDCAYYLNFLDDRYGGGGRYRDFGHTVRPVTE